MLDTDTRPIILLKQFCVALIYALLAHVTHLYFGSDEVASVFEPASGWALAALLAGGLRYAWGVFFGALLIHVLSGNPLWSTAVIALGSTLGLLFGAWLLMRDDRFDSRLRTLHDYLRLILVGGVGSGIGVLIGATAWLVYGSPFSRNPLLEMMHWWMGDVLGIILVTPLFLVWRLEKRDWLEMRKWHAAALLLGLTFLAGQAVFLGWFDESIGPVAKGYMMFLFIAWVAVRLGTWGTVVALLVTAVQALLGAHYGTGFFANDIAATQLTNYWLYMAILSVVGMALATHFAERKQAERQLHNLSAHLQDVREEEKAHIAREIHDELGGTLTAIKMDAYWLARAVPAGRETAPLLERIESMSQLIDSAVGVTRRVITELRPTILDDLGLLAAIEWHAAQFQKRTGITCQVSCTEDKGGLDKQRSIALFRIFQEALTNVARHSGASVVEVEFCHSDSEVVLSVCDNGCGIPGGHAIAQNSYGIYGMFERVGQLGGRIRIDNLPGGGLSVAVVLPSSDNHRKEE